MFNEETLYEVSDAAADVGDRPDCEFGRRKKIRKNTGFCGCTLPLAWANVQSNARDFANAHKVLPLLVESGPEVEESLAEGLTTSSEC